MKTLWHFLQYLICQTKLPHLGLEFLQAFKFWRLFLLKKCFLSSSVKKPQIKWKCMWEWLKYLFTDSQFILFDVIQHFGTHKSVCSLRKVILSKDLWQTYFKTLLNTTEIRLSFYIYDWIFDINIKKMRWKHTLGACWGIWWLKPMESLCPLGLLELLGVGFRPLCLDIF